jgi:hypothetical protein
MRKALRRLAILFGGVVGGSAVLGLFFGLLVGAGVGRSVSVAWYISGSAILIGGFFVGNRGPSRPQGDGWSLFSLKRWVRWATPEEQHESISLSAILITLGFVLIVLGALADTRYALT